MTYRHPPGVEYETKFGNISGLRLCPSRFDNCRTDHPPMSGFFFMGVPVHVSQSESLDLNIESVFDVDDESFLKKIGTVIVFITSLISSIVS